MKEFDRFSFPRNYSGKVPLFFRKFPEKFRREFPEISELTTLLSVQQCILTDSCYCTVSSTRLINNHFVFGTKIWSNTLLAKLEKLVTRTKLTINMQYFHIQIYYFASTFTLHLPLPSQNALLRLSLP